jgi:acyl-CoA thioesterase
MTTAGERPKRFIQQVGLAVEEPAAGRSRCTLAIEPMHFNGTGVVHGGVLFTLADTGMGAAIYSLLEKGQFCATVEIKIAYFKAVTGGLVVCDTVVVNAGKRLASVESTLTVEGQLVAKATGTFAVLQRKPPSPR